MCIVGKSQQWVTPIVSIEWFRDVVMVAGSFQSICLFLFCVCMCVYVCLSVCPPDSSVWTMQQIHEAENRSQRFQSNVQCRVLRVPFGQPRSPSLCEITACVRVSNLSPRFAPLPPAFLRWSFAQDNDCSEELLVLHRGLGLRWWVERLLKWSKAVDELSLFLIDRLSWKIYLVCFFHFLFF